MQIILKLLKWLGIVIVSVLLIAVVYLYATGKDFLLKGVYVTYLHGHKTAYLDDYRFFDNHEIETGTPQPWNISKEYNSIKITDSLRSIHDRWKSVAYMIIHKDSIWFEEYYGGYSDSSRSNSFSMAKSMVAALLGKTIESGQVKSLQQKVKDFVPELIGPYADSLKMVDLVSMSSGMKWDESYYDPFSITTRLYFDKDIVGTLDQLPINNQPGQKFIYKSGDTQLLGIALQRATKKSLSELLSQYFWKPMGAEHTALWQVDSKKHGIEKAYCCVASNARDFARFGKLYMDHGNWNGQQLLDSAYIKQSVTNTFADSPEYGYGWWIGKYKDKDYFYMDGHLGQYVISIPQDDLIIVRLGHGIGGKPRSNPGSAFYNFIDQAYIMLGDRIKEN
ncbi:serine hydrolase domain-containing protein [Sphingobacterium mizutaii]|uniref:serine hydrolase domain-containing protein n=1 Tax=Sphingobacterium mizutaii TaxID=1010 RepID=UPI001629CBB7|nr:serine hydrolase [Sphingobacterium mizutaii]